MPHAPTSGGDRIWRPTRLAIYARDNFECVACGARPERHGDLIFAALGAPIFFDGYATDPLTIDHVVPPSRGGSFTGPENLVTLCVSCNSAKQDRELAEWATPDVVERIESAVRWPLDRALGRRLCDVLYPGYRARQQKRATQRKHAFLARQRALMEAAE